jgi:hypothetical protein
MARRAPKLSAAERRRRARDYKLAAEAEVAAQRARRAEKAKAARDAKRYIREAEAARKAAKAEQERTRRRKQKSEREARILSRSITPRPKSYRGAFERLRELAADTLGVRVGLGVELLAGIPGDARGTPWAAVGTLDHEAADYAALHEVFAAWKGDAELRREIGIDRYARISVFYEGPESRGSRRLVEREWTVSEIAPWDVCASRAAEETDPDGDDTAAVRYDSSIGTKIKIWISHKEARSVPF